MPNGPRQPKPELEHDLGRAPSMGYERADEVGIIRCLSHGFPTPLARWHCHDEYELHLITATSGRAFIGDWIGQFHPGHLVLTGPRLPHNWVSVDLPDGGVTQRDLVIQFPHEPIEQCCRHIPELRAVLPLLDRAKHGIEFFDLHPQALEYWNNIKTSQGLTRLGRFFEFLGLLAQCTDYRLLSNAQIQCTDNDDQLEQINAILRRITDNLGEDLSASALARELGMNDSRFSRFFRRATGNTFTDFVNQVRINRACHMLMESNRQITDIGYEVGFNNIANFNRRFLDITGMTPREYRRQGATRFGSKR